MNLQILFDAYNKYIESFDQHEKNIIGTDTLLDSWLNVGKAQRYELPRHMLREMCFLPPTLQPASHDTILLSMAKDDMIDTSMLNKISKQHQSRYILIKQDCGFNHDFIFCKFNFFKNKWNFEKLARIPFKQINFPEQMNCPQFKKRESDLRNNFEFNSQDYWPWTRVDGIEDGDYLYDEYLYFSIQEVVFANTKDQFEELFPLTKNSTLGIEYTLARGNSVMCFAVDNPTGHNNFLKYKAADDLRSFQKLLQKRILERESFILKISNIDNAIEANNSNNQLKFGS